MTPCLKPLLLCPMVTLTLALLPTPAARAATVAASQPPQQVAAPLPSVPQRARAHLNNLVTRPLHAADARARLVLAVVTTVGVRHVLPLATGMAVGLLTVSAAPAVALLVWFGRSSVLLIHDLLARAPMFRPRSLEHASVFNAASNGYAPPQRPVFSTVPWLTVGSFPMAAGAGSAASILTAAMQERLLGPAQRRE